MIAIWLLTVLIPGRTICFEGDHPFLAEMSRQIKARAQGPYKSTFADPKSRALAKAIKANDIEGARKAIQDGANPDHDEFNHSYLNDLYGGMQDRIGMAKLLVVSGADVNHQAYAYGSTPLGLDAGNYGDSTEFAKFLIDHGADVNKIGSHGLAPLHEAVRQGNQRIVKLLLAHHANPSAGATWPPAEFIAAYRQEDQITQDWLLHKYDPMNRWYAGIPPLAELSRKWDQQIAEMLIQAGAKPDQADDFGMTALHHAVFASNKTGVNALIKMGLSINSTTKAGSTPLHLVVIDHRGYNRYPEPKPEMIPFLIGLGANPNLRNNAQQTPIELLHADAKAMLLHFKSTPNWPKEDREKYLGFAVGLAKIFDPKFVSIVEPSLPVGKDGTVYDPIYLGGFQLRWREYDPPDPGFHTGQPLYSDESIVTAERAVSANSQGTILTLRLTGTVLDSATLILHQLKLGGFQTHSKLPLVVILKKGVPQTFRFEFPTDAAKGDCAIFLKDVVTNLSEPNDYVRQTSEDEIDESKP